MKHYILFALFLLSSLIAMAKSQVALIAGDDDSEELADLTLVTLNNSSFTFLERGQIQRILDEQKLVSAKLTSSGIRKIKNMNSVDLFAIIRKDKKNSGYLLVIFDMTSGIRLIYQRLPKDISAATTKVKKSLRKAEAVKKNPQIYPAIVIANVNNAGSSPQLSEQLKDFAKEFELSLSNVPTLLVLERNSLNQITQERHVTRSFYPLLTSSYYLRMEFTPGSESNIINASITVTDISKKILCQFNTKNILSAPAKSIDLLLSKLSNFIERRSLVKNDNKKEAKMLYEDYKKNGYSETAKIEAAIALDSKNFIYKNELLSNLDKPYRLKGIPNKLANLSRYWNVYQRFKSDFPKYYSKYPQVPTRLLSDLYMQRKKLASLQLAEIKKKLPEMRSEYIKRSQIKFKKYPQTTYWRPVAYVPMPYLYFNDRLYIKEKYQYWIKAINAIRENKNLCPTERYVGYRKLCGQISESYYRLRYMQGRNNLNAQKQLYSELKKFIKAAENHPIKRIDAIAYDFKMIIELYNSPASANKKIIKKFFYAKMKEYPTCNISPSVFMLLSPKENYKCNQLLREIYKEYQLGQL